MKITTDISYLIGVLHSDGSIYLFQDKVRKRKIIRLNLTIGEKSPPMAKKFQSILIKSLNRKVNIRKIANKNSYQMQTSINKLWHHFSEWNKLHLPNEIKNDNKLFGAYLAGQLDGDGHFKLKNNRDRKLQQMTIRMTSSPP